MDYRKIVLVDDHVIIRNGMKELIEKLGPYKISGEFDNGRQLLDALPMAEDPDLIIMDLSMPEMDGEEALVTLKNSGVEIPVLILTLNDDDARVVRLFRSGARGYLQKSCTSIQLKRALEEVLTSGYFHNEFLTMSLRDVPQQKNDPASAVLAQLSSREREFLRLVCNENEYTYDQIAGIMNVQHRTVDGYRESLFDKFGIKSKTGLVLFVLKHDLFNRL